MARLTSTKSTQYVVNGRVTVLIVLFGILSTFVDSPVSVSTQSAFLSFSLVGGRILKKY